MYLARRQHGDPAVNPLAVNPLAVNTLAVNPTVVKPTVEKDLAVGAAEIAEAQSIPLQYTQQILHRLRKGGVIKSIRGPHGGFCLARPAGNINLKEILHAAEGDTFEVICETDPVRPNAEHPHRCSSDYNCSLRHVWYNLKTAVNQFLEAYTLERLLQAEDEFPARILQEQLVQFPRPSA